MTSKKLKLYKDIFISSLVSLISSHSASSEDLIQSTFSENTRDDLKVLPNDATPNVTGTAKPKLTKPFILKRFDELHALNLSHRSHRSHSSHRSHYSSSGSSSRGSSSSSSSGSSSPSRSSSSGSSTKQPSNAPSSNLGATSGPASNLSQPVTPRSGDQAQQPAFKLADPKRFKLGDRVIRLGMKGLDVTEAINILIKKEYLISESQSFTVELEYTQVISDAIKRFQTDNGIEATGIINSQTVSLLKL
ncbi:peptidoglycan-binding domain-containing protein [Ravibacter arvi]|uniref:peptidoglycan-binding domain-containing protein n=1 Tax=Ravibacter arvi TaxID=2051041 RepID=UPI0031EA97AB